jgi:hypothetical protein
MANPIKVVYSWIGPKGPIPNTELPNILSFAHVAENTSTNSTKFWSDDLYWRIFLNNDDYTLASSFGITDKDELLFPLTLVWRLTFNTYFFPNSGILEYSHISGNVLHSIKNKKGYILLECGPEAWVKSEQLEHIHRYFNHSSVPLNKIIYLTGCMNASAIYDAWCIENNIENSKKARINLIPYPLARYHMANAMNLYDHIEPKYDVETIPEKLFLCWNRRFRPHRSLLLMALNKLGLSDRSYYSMGDVDPEFRSTIFKQSVPIDLNNGNPYDLNDQDLINVTNKLPLVIDGETEITEMCTNGSGNAKTFYENSLVSLVTETNWDLPHVTSTEKSFKPFAEKHPFIIIGVNGALKSMHELGFKTFSEFWDESYDEIEDPTLRLVKIIEVCKEIGTWDNEKILDFKRKVKSVIEHNYIVMKNSSTKDIADKIREIIKKDTE